MTTHRTRRVFEELAAATWSRLTDARALDISIGEETLTDINLLDLSRHRLPSIRVAKCPKQDEAVFGIDWEWFVGSRRFGWIRFAVQAKKLNAASGAYDKLRYPVTRTLPDGTEVTHRQDEILERYANVVGAVPIYCLYNLPVEPSPKIAFECCQDTPVEQFGCTLAHLHTVQSANSIRVKKSFDLLHSDPRTHPWRCMFCPVYSPIWPFEFGPPSRGLRDRAYYRTLPPHISQLFEHELSEQEATEQKPMHLVRSQDLDTTENESLDTATARLGGVSIVPKRFMLIDVALD